MAVNEETNRTITLDLGPVSAYAIAVAEGFKGSRAEWESYIAGVGVNAEKAHEYALASEGYANGKQDGVDVTDPLSPYHGNNADYFAQQAARSADAAEDAKQAIEDMTVSSETLTSGSPATVTKTTDPQTGVVNLNFGIPAGADGEDADVSALAPVIKASAGPASILTITDGAEDRAMDSLVVGIEPVQDLHGYDSPWPAGGGKNKLPPIKYQWTATTVVLGQDNVNNFEIHLSAGTYTVSVDTNKTISIFYRTSTGTSNILIANAKTGTFTLSEASDIRLWVYGSDITVDDITTFQLESGSSATAYAPYENVCPISGWGAVKLFRTGANLLPLTLPSNAFNGSFSTGSTTISNATYGRCWCMYIGKNTNIYWQNEDTGAVVMFAFSDVYMVKRTDGQIYNAINCASRNNVVLNSGEHPYLIINVSNAVILTPETGAIDVRRCMLSFGSNRKNYEPRRNLDTYDIAFPSEAGTVYGSLLNPTKGTLTVNRVRERLTSALPWNSWGVNYSQNGITGFYVYRNYSGVTIDFTNLNVATITNLLPIVASVWGGRNIGYKTNNDGDQSNWYEIVSLSNSSIGIIDTDTKEQAMEKFKAFLDQNPLYVVYELNEPVVYTLESITISTLLGTNNLWADTGDVSAEYSADTKLYIEQLTKPTEDDMKANTAITSGKFFMIGNRLFLATAAIASGATIIPGTNCTELSLADALNNINA